ncbi:spore coat protein B [Sporosarcina luteola]|nr:spore coat protein B [Sporosarcina luteola]
MNSELLLSLVGKVIKVDRGGPESRIGKLLAVNEDHITLLTEDDGVIYYKAHHIKSLTANTKSGLNFNIEVPENFEYKTAKTFKGILENLKYHWVKINRGGPEKLEGVLDDISDDFVTIILNEEVVRLSMFHIRNISYGEKVQKSDEADKEEKQEGQSKEQEKSKQDNSNKKSNAEQGNEKKKEK